MNSNHSSFTSHGTKRTKPPPRNKKITTIPRITPQKTVVKKETHAFDRLKSEQNKKRLYNERRKMSAQSIKNSNSGTTNVTSNYVSSCTPCTLTVCNSLNSSRKTSKTTTRASARSGNTILEEPSQAVVPKGKGKRIFS